MLTFGKQWFESFLGRLTYRALVIMIKYLNVKGYFESLNKKHDIGGK